MKGFSIQRWNLIGAELRTGIIYFPFEFNRVRLESCNYTSIFFIDESAHYTRRLLLL